MRIDAAATCPRKAKGQRRLKTRILTCHNHGDGRLIRFGWVFLGLARSVGRLLIQ